MQENNYHYSRSPKKLLILAGGFGTRLRSVVADRPKSLALVHQKPMLEHILEAWLGVGIRDFVFLLCYESEKILNFLNAKQNTLLKNVRFEFVVERSPLGTGGAVANAIQFLQITDNFLLVNSDTWIEKSDNLKMLNSPCPSIAVSYSSRLKDYGVVEIDDSEKVVNFSEKVNSDIGGWINAGMYHLSPNIFCSWDGNPMSLEYELLPKLVSEKRLSAVMLARDFIDIGIPSRYEYLKKVVPQEDEDL